MAVFEAGGHGDLGDIDNPVGTDVFSAGAFDDSTDHGPR